MKVLPTDLQLLDALVQPAYLLDTDGTVLARNGASGSPSVDPVGSSFGESMVAEPERGGFSEVLELVRTGTPWSGQFHLSTVRQDQPTGVRVSALRANGAVTGILVVTDVATRTRSAGSADAGLAERLTRLAHVTTELLYAEDLQTVTDTVIQHLADAAGATTASLSVLVDDDTLALIGLRGGTPGAVSRWATYPVDAQTPAGEAVRSKKTLVMSGREEIAERFPDLDLAADGQRSMICMPLVVADRAVGVTSLSFPHRLELDQAELEFLQLLADQAAQAFERIRAVSDAADQAAKLQFVAEASAELASSLDYESTLRKVAWLAVPRFADWCAIALEEHGVLRTITVAHSDPEKLAIAEEYQRLFPPDPDSSSGSYEVLRSGQSQLTTEITDEQLVAAATDPVQLEMLRQLNFHSGLVVPLKARGRILGTLTWVSGETGRRFGFSDVRFGEDLARRAAVAIDNALLHRELREVADRLQEAVRPAPLPRDLPAWELAAVYSQAGRTDVGGDFYDVIPVDEHRLVVFVGEVMGRGVQAAAAMSQIRAGVRTLAAVDPDPASVMARLDLLFDQYPTNQLVTLAYGVLDLRTDELAVASAGHPPPLVLNQDGTGSYVDTRGLILGAGSAHREVSVVAFRPGQTLLLYTDGLLERRTEDLEVGKQRLLSAARSLLSVGALQDALPGLANGVRDHTREDDLAVLAVRRRLI
jgi:serine phosphatase RsbU (regulator of sigma subunit)